MSSACQVKSAPSSGLVKSAKALKVLNRLFGKNLVSKWRRMAAAKDRGLIHDIGDKLVSSGPEVIPYGKRWRWMDRLGNEGLRDLTYNPATELYSFSASPRHLDAIDPTGWLRREFMATQGRHGYSPWTSVPEQFYTRRDRTLVPDWVGSSAKPTVHETPMRITASEFSRMRIRQAFDRALERSTPGRGELRELPPDQAGYLINRNNAFNSDKIPGRELSDAITKTLSQDMVDTGFARQSLAGAARILPYSRYDVDTPFFTRNHLKSMHGMVPVAMGRNHYSNAEAQVLPFARRVLLPVSWKVKAPSPTVLYDQGTLAHEMGHMKGGVLGTMGPKIFGGLSGWAFPGLRMRSLLERKPLMAAAFNGRVGPEYVANRIAFGAPSRWPARIHAAYDTYLLGALSDMMAKGRAFSPEEYRMFMRNYLPNGVTS